MFNLGSRVCLVTRPRWINDSYKMNRGRYETLDGEKQREKRKSGRQCTGRVKCTYTWRNKNKKVKPASSERLYKINACLFQCRGAGRYSPPPPNPLLRNLQCHEVVYLFLPYSPIYFLTSWQHHAARHTCFAIKPFILYLSYLYEK
jgi:hypothetical protein